MSSLEQLETVILLLMAVLALTTIARKLVIPYPILLVIGGVALVFIPGLPVIHLDPDLVFLVFLPPILWAAAYVTSWRDFRANLRPITLHAVGLVLVTTAAVAIVAHAALPGLGWAGAIALGSHCFSSGCRFGDRDRKTATPSSPRPRNTGGRESRE
jgi:NhaP-type Na+/H+ or K+/H+ antiporter